MRGFLPVVLCVAGAFATSAYGQSAGIQPIHVAIGTTLTFYSQTRLNPGTGNILDELPKGTALKVKMLESIDSSTDRDGLEFRGALITPLVSGNEIIVHSDAEVRGLLVLLRSRNHPEGFRFELLVTSISENGKSYELTASLNPSFFETASQHTSNPAPVAPEPAKEQQPAITRLPASKN
jgi:hypothetical protein